MSEWKPGDVARRRGPHHRAGDREKLSVVVAGCAIEQHDSGPHWHHDDNGWAAIDGQSTYRRLVVIDPEDREAAERLANAIITTQRGIIGPVADDVQVALREFANPTPPKPDEPTSRYAVVLDREGTEWIRDRLGRWCHTSVSTGHRWVTKPWDDIDAVEVLSEGVQP